MKRLAESQIVWWHNGQDFAEIQLPAPDAEVVPGVFWGRADELFTPSFWKYQSQIMGHRRQYLDHELGRCLAEEVAACLLGGYGIPAELGLAAFERLRDAKLLEGRPSAAELEAELRKDFKVANRRRKYRFAKQKSVYLAGALCSIASDKPPEEPHQLRLYLTSLKGVGPKTASWVVRNHCASDQVAILDVHIMRAGIRIGLFSQDADPSKQYYQLEERFLSFCDAIEEPASRMDAIMWDFMRRIGSRSRPRPLDSQLAA